MSTQADLALRGSGDESSLIELKRVSGDLLVASARVNGFARPFKVLIVSSASRNYGRKQSVAEDSALFAQACERDLGMISVRLATGAQAATKKVEIDLRVAFFDFDSVEGFTLLHIDDRFDLILGMPWLESHQARIEWRTKSIGSSTPRRGKALVRHEPTFAHIGVSRSSDEQVAGVHFIGMCDIKTLEHGALASALEPLLVPEVQKTLECGMLASALEPLLVRENWTVLEQDLLAPALEPLLVPNISPKQVQ